MTMTAPWESLASAGLRLPSVLPSLLLDGFLTGVIVAPRPIPTVHWLGAVLADDDPVPRDTTRLQAEHDAVTGQVGRRRCGSAEPAGNLRPMKRFISTWCSFISRRGSGDS